MIVLIIKPALQGVTSIFSGQSKSPAMHYIIHSCMWIYMGPLCLVSASGIAVQPQRDCDKKRPKMVKLGCSPFGCKAAACFLGNNGVWLPARPCNVECIHCIEVSLNVHTFLSQRSTQYTVSCSYHLLQGRVHIGR